MFSTLRQKKILGCVPGRSTATGTMRPSLTRGQMTGIGMGSDEKVGTVDWGGRQRSRLPGSARVCSAARASIFHDDWGPVTTHFRPVTELRRCRSGLRLTGRGHLEGSQHLTFNDLTVDNCNILNTAQLLQLVTAYSVFFFAATLIWAP